MFLLPNLYLAGGIAVVVIGLAGSTALYRHELADEKKAHKDDMDLLVAKYTKEALVATERARAAEKGWQDAKDQAEKLRAADAVATAAEADRLRGEHAAAVAAGDGLRKQLVSYALGGAAAKDSLATCRARSATLGDVLAAGEAASEQAESVADDLAASAERHAGEVRVLKASYPKN